MQGVKVLQSEWAVKMHIQDGVTGTQRDWKELCTACAQQRMRKQAHCVSEHWELCFGQSEYSQGVNCTYGMFWLPAGIHQGLSPLSDEMASTMIWGKSCVDGKSLPSGDAFPFISQDGNLKKPNHSKISKSQTSFCVRTKKSP